MKNLVQTNNVNRRVLYHPVGFMLRGGTSRISS